MNGGELENVEYQYKSLYEINDLLSSDPEFHWFYIMRANYNARASKNPEIQSCEIILVNYAFSQAREVVDRMKKFLKNCDNEDDSRVGSSVLKDLGKALDLGEKYRMFRGSLDKKNLKNVLERQPKTSYEFEARGCHIMQHFPSKFDESDADLSKAIDMSPNCLTALYQRAFYHRLYDRMHGMWSPQKYLDGFEKLISIDPNFACAYSGTGNAHFDLNERSKSLREYTTGIQLLKMSESTNPIENHLLSSMFYSRSRTRNRDISGRFRDLHLAIKANPNNFKALTSLGWQYFRHKSDNQKALAYCNRALKVKNDYVFSFFNRGNVFKSLGEYKFAINDFSRVISPTSGSINKQRRLSYYRRGECFLHLEMFEKAILDFSEGAKLGMYGCLGMRAIAVEKLKEKIMKM